MNPSELQSFFNIGFLLGGVIFNIAFWYFKLQDIEKRLTTSGKRIGAVDKRLNRLINKGNRKLGWDFEWENDRDDE